MYFKMLIIFSVCFLLVPQSVFSENSKDFIVYSIDSNPEKFKGSKLYQQRVKAYSKDNRPKIVGGEEVKQKNKFPWQVSIGVSWIQDPLEAHFCGGSILSDRWVVTAAHCVDNTSPIHLKITAGTIKLMRGIITHNVENIIIPGDFNDDTLDNDIALLKLKTPINIDNNLTKSIAYANIEDEKQVILQDIKLTTLGWGTTTEKEKDKYVMTLRYIYDIPYVKREFCNKPLAYDGEVTENMICAGFEIGGKSVCKGDSGGGLFALINNEIKLIGITSWGKGCARPNKVGVYTRMVSFSKWTKDVMNSFL